MCRYAASRGTASRPTWTHHSRILWESRRVTRCTLCHPCLCHGVTTVRWPLCPLRLAPSLPTILTVGQAYYSKIWLSTHVPQPPLPPVLFLTPVEVSMKHKEDYSSTVHLLAGSHQGLGGCLHIYSKRHTTDSPAPTSKNTHVLLPFCFSNSHICRAALSSLGCGKPLPHYQTGVVTSKNRPRRAARHAPV